jgi:copper transport protein
VLIAAAQLTASSPPRGPQFAAPRRVLAPTLVRQVDDVLVTVTPRPNRPGANVVTVLAVSSRRPPPAPIDAVTLSIGGRPPVALHALAPGRWSGGADLVRPGRSRMTILVRRGRRRLWGSLPWTIAPADAARPVVVSARRLAPTANAAGLLVALAAAAGGLAIALATARRRSRPSRRSTAPTTLGERTT